jgi:hypothetical protein
VAINGLDPPLVLTLRYLPSSSKSQVKLRAKGGGTGGTQFNPVLSPADQEYPEPWILNSLEAEREMSTVDEILVTCSAVKLSAVI